MTTLLNVEYGEGPVRGDDGVNDDLGKWWFLCDPGTMGVFGDMAACCGGGSRERAESVEEA